MARIPLTGRQRLARASARVLAAFGVLTVLGVAAENGPGALLLGVVLALAPVPVYVLFVLALDRFEPEPPRLLRWAFAWGALGATFLAGLLNDAGGAALASAIGASADQAAAVFVAPVVEESLKAVLLLALFWWKRDEFDGPVDGIVYGAMTALGFATVENVMYYAEAAAEGGMSQASSLFMLRGVLGGLGHPLYTAMTGIGLGTAAVASARRWKVLAPVMGLTAAVLLHMSWNAGASAAQATQGMSLLIVYAGIFLPALAGCLWFAVRALRREGARIADALAPDAVAGHLPPEVLASLRTVFGRTAASVQALRRGGVRTWRAQRAFHRAASEEGLRRCRAAAGRDPDTVPRFDYVALYAACVSH